MDADELKRRLKALGYSQRVAAEKLGLSLDGLAKQLYRVTKVSRQTEIIVELRERLERPDIVVARDRAARYAGLHALFQRPAPDRQTVSPAAAPDRQDPTPAAPPTDMPVRQDAPTANPPLDTPIRRIAMPVTVTSRPLFPASYLTQESRDLALRKATPVRRKTGKRR